MKPKRAGGRAVVEMKPWRGWCWVDLYGRMLTEPKRRKVYVAARYVSYGDRFAHVEVRELPRRKRNGNK